MIDNFAFFLCYPTIIKRLRDKDLINLITHIVFPPWFSPDHFNSLLLFLLLVCPIVTLFPVSFTLTLVHLLLVPPSLSFLFFFSFLSSVFLSLYDVPSRVTFFFLSSPFFLGWKFSNEHGCVIVPVSSTCRWRNCCCCCCCFTSTICSFKGCKWKMLREKSLFSHRI